MGLAGCPLPAGQSRTRQAQFPPAALQKAPGHGWLRGLSQPQGMPCAEDGGSGSPAGTAASGDARLPGRAEPGRMEGKGMARLPGTSGLRSSWGCSVLISGKVVINVRKVPELSLQREGGPATRPGRWHGHVTQQTVSAGACSQPFIPRSYTSCHLQKTLQRLLPQLLQLHGVSPPQLHYGAPRLPRTLCRLAPPRAQRQGRGGCQPRRVLAAGTQREGSPLLLLPSSWRWAGNQRCLHATLVPRDGKGCRGRDAGVWWL